MPDNSITIGQPWEMFNVGGYIVRSKSGTLTGFGTKSAVVPELRLSFAFCFNGADSSFNSDDERTVA